MGGRWAATRDKNVGAPLKEDPDAVDFDVDINNRIGTDLVQHKDSTLG